MGGNQTAENARRAQEALERGRETDCHERLREANRAHTATANRLTNARAEVERVKLAFRESLTVGRNVPCAVAILPSGKVVVHVWTDKPELANQLHIVEAGYYTEDAICAEG